MNTFVLFTFIGLSILGFVHTYRIAMRLKEIESPVRWKDLEQFSALDLTCLMVFGPFVLVLLKIRNKVLG